MNPRITDPSGTNKPVIGTLSNKVDILNEYDYQLTRKKIFVRYSLVLLISIIIIATLYCGLFVLDFGKVPGKSISVGKVNISQDDMLSFQLQANDYYLTGSPAYDYAMENENSIVYFAVRQPLISNKVSSEDIKTGISANNYELDVKGISAVYYKGNNRNDKVLIWKR